MKEIYLDNAATTAVRPEVAETMLPYFTKTFGNPSSLHTTGQKAKRALEQARQDVADILQVGSKEIFFTSGGTESNNLAIKGFVYANRHHGNHLITSAIEHPSVLNVFQELENQGYHVTFLPVDQHGIIDLNALKESIRPETILISIMLANNEIGTIEPLKEVTTIAHERAITVHTDAVQAVGKIPVSIKELDVDLLSLTAHKFYGPKGFGALYKNNKLKIAPLMKGGHQEYVLRPGTENVPGAVGLSAALKMAYQELDSTAVHLENLRNRLENNIHNRIGHVKVNGATQQRLPNISSLSFSFIEGEALLLALDTMGIAVSTASACSSGSTEPSHVLKAIDLDPLLAQGTLRFSLGRRNTFEEIDYVTEVLADTVNRLRELSPVRDTRTTD